MKPFKITTEQGIVYTNLQDFYNDICVNGDTTDDNIDEEAAAYLDEYIWEAIEEGNGKIEDETLMLIFEDYIDIPEFVYMYRYDTKLIEYDIDRGLAYTRQVIKSPSGRYFSIVRMDSAYSWEYPDGHYFEEVKPVEKTIIDWEVIG